MSRAIYALFGLAVCITLAPAARAAADDEAAEAKAKLAAERLQFKAELAKKQKQIDALVQILKENNIEVPADVGSGGATAAAPNAPTVDKGPWVVQIAANEEVSVDDARQRLLAARDRLADADRQMVDAKNRYARMQDSYEYYWDNRGTRQRRMKHTNAELGSARAEVSRFEADRRRASQQIAQAERQIADAGKNRTVVGHLEDGTAADITAGNDAAAAMLRGLEVGALYKITGIGTREQGALKIKAHTAVRASAPVQAVAPPDVSAPGEPAVPGASRAVPARGGVPQPRPAR
jgi:septal ring factor EnvC (AmiA/AmiB activator)